MSLKLAAFDFDGTLTTKDTLFQFIEFCFGRKKLIKGLLMMLPTLVLHNAKFLSSEVAKQKLFTHFFKDLAQSDFNDFCFGFKDKINKIINPVALKKLQWHQSQGHTVIIISASIEDWILPWANENGIDYVIATRIEVVDGKISGKFKSKNCSGMEKERRLREHHAFRGISLIYAYGDTKGDKEMLDMADFKFYRCF